MKHRSKHILIWTAVFSLLTGVGVYFSGRCVKINEVMLTHGKGLRLAPQMDKPDFYLKLITTKGIIKTDPIDDKPVGSGLPIRFTPGVPLCAIEEIELWDLDTFNADDLIDRSLVHGRNAEGEDYRFAFRGPLSILNLIAWVAFGISLLFFLIYLTGFIMSHATEETDNT